MKILLTGASGQLGRELTQFPTGPDMHLMGFSRTELDITNMDEVRARLRSLRPDVVIHAAAYTAVDLAESRPEDAYRVNVAGTRNVAVTAEEIGARLCYISTDYVFDGTATVPYNEYDNANPQSTYGKSKRAGEVLVQGLCSNWFIVRTSWVYGRYGANFVNTMLTKSKEVPRLRVVEDQIGCPTYTKDLAQFLFDLVRTECYGIYHVTNEGSCSWYEFALAILDAAGILTPVDPCSTEEFQRPAPRPRYSVLGKTALRANGFTPLRHWKHALAQFLREVVPNETH